MIPIEYTEKFKNELRITEGVLCGISGILETGGYGNLVVSLLGSPRVWKLEGAIHGGRKVIGEGNTLEKAIRCYHSSIMSAVSKNEDQ